MNVKKFVAASSREAWRNVRETLGPDAVILSNRTVDGGVEILAMANEDMSTLAASAPARAVQPRSVANPPQSASAQAASQAYAQQSSGDLSDAPLAQVSPLSASASAPATVYRTEHGYQPHLQAASAPQQSALTPSMLAAASASVRREEHRLAAVPSAAVPAAAPGRSAAPAMHAAAPVPMPSSPAIAASAPVAAVSPRPQAAARATAAAAAPAPAPAAEARVWRNRTGANPQVQAANLAELMAARRQQANATEQAAAAYSEVMNEIRQMRGALESQLAEISWDHTQKRDPHKADVMREMLAAGFSASLSRLMTEHLPRTATAKEGIAWVKTVLARNLMTMSNENELLEQGGVYALVGPTGVGKTTTTAKLAARCVMRHGANKLALITTDGYRIGAYEQLRIYGKILGVMVHSVKDEADLRIALEELKGKHTVLIDTVGVGQRDQMVAEQVAMLSGAGAHVKRLLCLNATVTGSTLNEVVAAYKGDGLAGCIVTKLDEAATIGNVIDIVIRQKLNLYYVANGQRVPEDLHIANKLYLTDRAFKQKRETGPFEFQDAELPLVVGPAARATNDKTLREVIIG